MGTKKNRFPFLSLREPWSKNENAIWLASTLRLHRNVEKHCFPGKLSANERQKLVDHLSQSFLKCPLLRSPQFYAANDLEPVEKEFLYEHFLSGRGFQQAGAGEGFIVDTSGTFFALLNLRDHVQFQITDCDQELERGWNQLSAIENSLAQYVKFAFSPRFGFLTAEATRCGTGLAAATYLHLPALRHTQTLTEAVNKCADNGIEVGSLTGELSSVVGDLVILRNARTLGITDETTLQTLRSESLKLIVAEKSARSSLRSAPSNKLRDQVGRAFGLLSHSYQLETQEAWDALSLLKLAIDLEWVGGLNHREANELFFSTPRSHLIAEYSERIPLQEVSHRRADFLHAHLQKAKLHI